MSQCPQLLKERLQSLVDLLRVVRSGGHGLSSATVGYEREAVATALLGNVIAPPFRIGCGDILDSSGKTSGQMDIVIERTPSISFPLVSGLHPRLYLAEGVAAVVEVKSDLRKQWAQFKESASRLGQLKRHYKDIVAVIGKPSEQVPHYVVGYKGWKNIGALERHILDSHAMGVLSIEPCFYCSREPDGEQSIKRICGPVALARFMV